MVTQNTNPFVLPGFGQSGDMASNPMLASMEMMRKAWEGLASTGGFDKALMPAGASPEDLERRISDLRAVENWLRMNLAMLSSTIQTLEVQQSTLSTLQAFVASAGGGASGQSATASPLDVALGIRRGADAAPSADSSGFFGGSATPFAAQPQQAAPPAAEAPPTAKADAPASDQPDPVAATTGAVDSAMQSWWDMLQNQFDNLASATTATLQGAEAMQQATTAATKTAGAKKTAAKTSTAKKAPAKKAASRKAAGTTSSATAAVKKAATKKTATKAAAKKTTAKKTAAKKTAAKKTAK